MTLVNSLAYGLHSLRSGSVRTLLMLLAMSIGVAAVVLLTGIGNGARGYIVNEFASLGTNLIIVIPGRSETASGTISTLAGRTPRDLTLADAQTLTRSSRVSRVAPLNIGEMSAARGRRERQVPVLGSTSAFLHIHHLQLSRGRFLPDGDVNLARPVCVVGAEISRELFGEEPALGGQIRLGGYRCRIIGILEGQGRSLGMDTDELVVVPVAFAQMLLNTESLFRILVEVREPESIEKVKAFIADTIQQRHYGEKDVTIITQDSVLATFDTIFQVMTMTVAGIASISLAVAGILIMNVMLMSVSQRTAEIGLCKALGADRGQIMLLIVSEALFLSILGGCLGLVLGLAGSRMVTWLYPTLDAAPPFWAVGAAMSTALLTGLVFSLMPARRAAGLDPIQALSGR